MPIDPFDPGTSVAQEFTAQEPDKLRRLMGIIAAQKRETFDLRASVLANVSDIVANLRAQVADIAAASAAATAASGVATAASAAATAAVADLASRVTVTASIASFTSPYLPADSAWHAYGADIPITIAVPTGKLVVTVGCGTATITHDSTGSQIVAEATFSISGGIANYGDITADGAIYSPTLTANMPLCVQHAFTVPPGTYTITGKMRAQGASGTGAFVYFQNPYLTVQVTG